MEDKDCLKRWPSLKPPRDADDEEEPKVERDYAVEVSGKRFEVKVIGAALPNGGAGRGGGEEGAEAARARRAGGGGAPGAIVSPIQGTVLKVAVEKGATVEEGALICVVEAMKMENEITAPAAARSRS